MDSTHVLNQVNALGAGSGLKHMVLESIGKLDIPLPPLELQEQVVQEINRKLVEAYKILSISKRQQESITALPNAIMQGIFGKYVLPDED